MALLKSLAVGLLCCLQAISVDLQAEPLEESTFNILCYHDVLDEPGISADKYSISTAELVQQFAWLKEQGYQVVSVDDLLAAHSGERNLPAKAILLTFDDGYRGFYSQVYPLLKAFNYPAVLALVGSWMQLPSGEKVPYDAHDYTRASFLSENEIREMSSSGLVEIASHSFNLHRGIVANPQNNLLPSAVARRYDAQTQTYEDDKEYESRIRSDLQLNSDYIEHLTGRRPRVMVWPYGQYNQLTTRLAAELGMPVTLNLNDGANSTHASLAALSRWLIDGKTTMQSLADKLTLPQVSKPQRIMHVDLDYVYDPDPLRQEKNLGRLLDRVKAMHVNTVYLQAFADPDGNGSADRLYFPNRHLPMRADLFNRVAWQLKSRIGVKVFAWMPVLAFELPNDRRHEPQLVKSDSAALIESGYIRLSPFSESNRKAITEIYEDLATHALFDGVLFHDDATLNDFEDSSAAAVHFYHAVWGFPDSVADIRADPALMRKWTEHKTRYLIELTLSLADMLKRYQPGLKTARNLYAEVVLGPDAEEWYAQSMPDFLGSYDYTAVMAMPFMEKAHDPLAWINRLVQEVSQYPGALRKTVFELQSHDWRDSSNVDSQLVARQMGLLQLLGAVNFGYYPDDFLNNIPNLDTIWSGISLQDFPVRRTVE